MPTGKTRKPINAQGITRIATNLPRNQRRRTPQLLPKPTDRELRNAREVWIAAGQEIRSRFAD